MPNSDERNPLLSIDDHARNFWTFAPDQQREEFHDHFCRLVGIPPSDLPPDARPPRVGPKTLYGRAVRMKNDQGRTYAFTAAISNSLLLAQVVLGAAVTALGASESSHVLITLFGAANTIIAGVVAYLKSRGQPMRARMYRDDLERVVDEIENSEIMWLGISKNMHGYHAINTDDEVTVRSEVARLTRLYDRAIRTNTMNNPDMYMANGNFEGTNFALRKGPPPSGPAPPPAVPPPVPLTPAATVAAAGPSATGPPAPLVVVDPDESPASAPPKAKLESPKEKLATAGEETPPSKLAKDPIEKNAPSEDAINKPAEAGSGPDQTHSSSSTEVGESPTGKADMK